ncbi:MAG: Yip1 family protein [Gaiellaceae bacterium]
MKHGDPPAADHGSLDRDWWLRVPLVLRRPRAVFAALADDSQPGAEARQEPVMALVFLGGIGIVLAAGAGGRLAEEWVDDSVVIGVWAILGGAIQGLLSYFVLGGVALGVLRILGSKASYRQARHALAFSAAPLGLWLLTAWPVQLAVFGRDLFRPGGDDTGTGATVFDAVAAGFACWWVALLAIGLWSLRRV